MANLNNIMEVFQSSLQKIYFTAPACLFNIKTSACAISGSINAEPNTIIIPVNCQNVMVSWKKSMPNKAESIGVK